MRKCLWIVEFVLGELVLALLPHWTALTPLADALVAYLINLLE